MSIKLFFSGDVVIKENPGNELFHSSLHDIISNCDVACCNFEAPITTQRQVKSKKIGPHLSQSQATFDALVNVGFSLFALANNHIMDFGSKGLLGTIDAIKKAGKNYIGAGSNEKEAFQAFLYEKDNIKVAIVDVAENGFGSIVNKSDTGYAWFGQECYLPKLKELCRDYDHVIVICHAGAELWNVPLPEIRSLYKSWIDFGVTAVIAHHPHVPQGWEQYKSGMIYYSLGNFAFNKGLGIQNPKTISVLVDITPDGISFENLYTEFKNGTIGICRDQKFKEYMDEVSRILNKDNYTEYIEYVDKMSINKFKASYMGYYGSVLNYYDGSIKRFLKTFYFRYLKRERFSNTWLYHNLTIETHYWICRRALRLLEGKNNESTIR